jgi:catalase (peroxidase I)
MFDFFQGLIYVNPQGPMANGDPVASAADIRDVMFLN